MQKQDLQRQSGAVQSALYKLTCQWNVEPDKMFGKREQLEALCLKIGVDRFERTIANVIENHKGNFFPTIAQINEYIVREIRNTGFSDEEWAEMRYARDSDPDNHFGEADVLCSFRAQLKRMAEKKPLYTFYQLHQIILRARQKYGKKYEEIYKPVPQGHSEEPLTESDYL